MNDDLEEDDRKPAALPIGRIRRTTAVEGTVGIIKHTPPTTPLARVLEVFPDVDHNHAHKTIHDCKANIQMVLAILAERSYPKGVASLPPTIELLRDEQPPPFDDVLVAPPMFCGFGKRRKNAGRETIDLCDDNDGGGPASPSPASPMSQVPTPHITRLHSTCHALAPITPTTTKAAVSHKSSSQNRNSPQKLAASQPPGSFHLKPPPTTPLERVLEVFPDVDINHAHKTIRDCKANIQMVLAILAERSYPKAKAADGASLPTPGSSAGTGTNASVLIQRARAQPLHDYSSTSSFEPSALYVKEVSLQLLHEFPFLSKRGAKKLLQKHNNHYSPARDYVFDALKKGSSSSASSSSAKNRMTPEDREAAEYQRLKPALTKSLLAPGQAAKLGKDLVLRRPTQRPAPLLEDPILKDEVAHAHTKLRDWMAQAEEALRRKEAREKCDHTGSGVECGCCFDKVPIEEMVACRDEGHLFCTDCIRSYASTAIFSNGSLGTTENGKPSCELRCCDASGCTSGFHEAHLQRVLPPRMLEKYNELRFRASVEAAGLSGDLVVCPSCGFQADLPPNLVVFECPMEDCRHRSCRKCGKAPHVPLRCEEVVQKKREDEGRVRVEEAMAEAKIRKCYKCKTAFVKSDGCNKMTCRCGAKMCYQCRKPLEGHNPYDHFCRTPFCTHKSCGRCTLYSNAEEDDRRAMLEAGVKAAALYRTELREKQRKEQGVAPGDLRIEWSRKRQEGSRRGLSRSRSIVQKSLEQRIEEGTRLRLEGSVLWRRLPNLEKSLEQRIEEGTRIRQGESRRALSRRRAILQKSLERQIEENRPLSWKRQRGRRGGRFINGGRCYISERGGQEQQHRHGKDPRRSRGRNPTGRRGSQCRTRNQRRKERLHAECSFQGLVETALDRRGRPSSGSRGGGRDRVGAWEKREQEQLPRRRSRSAAGSSNSLKYYLGLKREIKNGSI